MKNTTLRSMILTALFAALTAIGAFLKITMPHVSFTLQVFFTCMAGLLLGRIGARRRSLCMCCSGWSACRSLRRAAA